MLFFDSFKKMKQIVKADLLCVSLLSSLSAVVIIEAMIPFKREMNGHLENERKREKRTTRLRDDNWCVKTA